MLDITTEFHQAFYSRDLDKLTNLLRRKEEIDVKQLDECHLLETAARKGQLEIVRLLLRVGFNVNQSHRIRGCTILHFACLGGHLQIVELLLENGADIDTIAKVANRTPLDVAVLHKKTSITKLLLENGCKTNVRNHKGQTALEVAMNRGYLDGFETACFQ